MIPLHDDTPHPPGFKPRMTQALIAVNVAVFFVEVIITGQFLDFTNRNAAAMFYEWGTVPACVTGAEYAVRGSVQIPCQPEPLFSLLTSTFMHGGLLHLGGNMLFLWIFADNIEAKLGKLRFLGIYLAWGVAAGLIHVAADPSSPIPAVGASGAISGVLGAYLVVFPRARILTFLFLGFFIQMVKIPAKWFLPFWLVFQNLLPFFVGGFGLGLDGGGGVAYMAHIGGFAVGLATGYLYKRTHRDQFTYGTRYGWRGDY